MSTIPFKIRAALDAEAEAGACDTRAHPRRSLNLQKAFSAARASLSKEYPEIEDWLFGYPYRNQSERVEELQRLIKEAQP